MTYIVLYATLSFLITCMKPIVIKITSIVEDISVMAINVNRVLKENEFKKC